MDPTSRQTGGNDAIDAIRALSLRRWEQARPLIRLRACEPRPTAPARPSFDLVLTVGDAVVRVDRALAAAWGRPVAELQRAALDGAVADLVRIDATTVTAGADCGAVIVVATGGVGTGALVLDPARITRRSESESGSGSESILTCSPAHRLVVAATPSSPDADALSALASRLRGPGLWPGGSPAGDRPILLCLQAGRLAIFEPEGP